MANPKILIVSNWDWVIYNFRLSLAEWAREDGYQVAFVCPDGDYVDELRGEKFRWIPWELDRRSLNPLTEIRSIWALAQIYKQEQPDIIHHDTIKPNTYGALAVWLNEKRNVGGSIPEVINSFMGVGFLFSGRPLARLLRPLVLPFMRFGMKRSYIYTTFSNEDDRKKFLDLGLVDSSRTQVMVSEFVDTNRFSPAEEPSNSSVGTDTVRVLLAARLLWDKGIQEYVDAAKMLDKRGVSVELLLAGEPDLETPGYVPTDRLQRWHENGVLKWLGHCSDMPTLLRSVDIASLPTHYNEGLPRFLVEAASSGLPVITSDLEACKRVVDNGVNGYVVPKQDASSLADAIQCLALNPQKRWEMGRASRRKAEAEFAEQNVVEKWLDLYAQRIG